MTSSTNPLDYGWWLASRAAGVTSMVLVSLSVLLGLAMAAGLLQRKPAWKKSVVALHEQMAVAGLVAIGVHGITLLGDTWLKASPIDLVAPFFMSYKPGFTGLGVRVVPAEFMKEKYADERSLFPWCEPVVFRAGPYFVHRITGPTARFWPDSLTIRTVAQSDHVTVYTRGRAEWKVKYNFSFWDDARLSVVTDETVTPAPSPTLYVTVTPPATVTPTATLPIATATPTSTATATPVRSMDNRGDELRITTNHAGGTARHAPWRWFDPAWNAPVGGSGRFGYFPRYESIDAANYGVLLNTILLVAGSIWGKTIWGTWWTWDARLTTTLILWFIYVGYLMLRSYGGDTPQIARSAAVIGIIGCIDIPIINQSVNWWRTLHPQPMVAGPDGPAMPPEDKDAALLPRRFHGRCRLVRLYRELPEGFRYHRYT